MNFLPLALLLCAVPAAARVAVEDLLSPAQRLEWKTTGPKGWTLIDRDGTTRVVATGKSTGGTVILRPATGNSFDASGYSYLRINIENKGDGMLWIAGRLDNPGAQEWSNNCSTQLFLQRGESGTLGFPYPRAPGRDDAPDIFDGMHAKPNGWRSHWKSFDPSRITQVRLRVLSAEGPPRLECRDLALAWPYGAKANETLLELPFLDRFGQVRQLEWPGKLKTADALKRRCEAELSALADQPRPEEFDRFGGWARGPQLEPTGFFRTAKHEGKWWLVDPEGRLFWSHGVDSIGFNASTPVNRRHALFAWLPAKDDPLHASAISSHGWRQSVDFLAANMHRTHGDRWEAAGRDLIHRRMSAWGLNTIGAWGDRTLVDDRRTPHTPVLHVWWPWLEEKLPNPFHPDAAPTLRKRLAELAAKHGKDPWCLGVFIDNELRWPHDLAEKALATPAGDPVKTFAVGILRNRHRTITELNRAWEADFESWDAVAVTAPHTWTRKRHPDFEAIQEAYAGTYYKLCRDTMRELMPNHLYLGSRINHCPDHVSRAAARHVDVFSVNHYWNVAGLGKAPKNADVPVLVTEFHFGALDRGVPGPSLSPVHDQTQRARAYQNYVLSALLHPRIVGTHWFAWVDQSAAGRPGENYQIGFVDVTNTPYLELTEAVRSTADVLYGVRHDGGNRLEILESISAPPKEPALTP